MPTERGACWALAQGTRNFPIAHAVCTVGRGHDADLQLDDLGVSRRHAALRVVEGRLFIEDLGSSNGTFVNGAKIDRAYVLRSGDELTIGQCELRVCIRAARRERAECTTQPIPRITAREPSPMAILSPRERELLPLLAGGLSQRELAQELGVTVKTIETYRTRIGHKLGLTSRAELIRFALDNGLLSSD